MVVWLGGFRQPLGLRSGLHHGRAAASQCLGGGAQLQRKPETGRRSIGVGHQNQGIFHHKMGNFHHNQEFKPRHGDGLKFKRNMDSILIQKKYVEQPRWKISATIVA